MEYSGKQQEVVVVEIGKCFLTVKSLVNVIAEP